jgi:hypothetical protein
LARVQGGDSAGLCKIDVEGEPESLNMENRTEPRTVGQWIRYLVVAAIALFLVWWMLRLYVL